MKVKIGKYVNHWNTYDLAEKIMFWVPKEVDEFGFKRSPDKVRKFGEYLTYGSVKPDPEVGDIFDVIDRREKTWLSRLLTFLSNKRKRKIDVRIDNYDTWSMYETLGYIIRPMLYEIKKNKSGAPYVDLNDVPVALHPKSELLEGGVDDTHFERWEWVINEMIFSFESIYGGKHVDWENEFIDDDVEFKFKKLENGNFELINNSSNPDKNKNERMEYMERVSRGFTLFGKYYQSLWT